MTAPTFNKYEIKGAYHWEDYFGGLRRMNAYTRARYDIVLNCTREAGVTSSSRLLEIGCGDGALLGVLHGALGLEVVGVDTSATGLALARQMFDQRGYVGEFRHVQGYGTGYPNNWFDIVVCSDVIEHVEDPIAMLKEIKRVLVPGGRLVITTPIKFSERPIDPMHVQEWFVGDFKSFCSKVFGEPVREIQSHPVLWYELVSSGQRWIGFAGRLITNVLTRLGRNPFLESGGIWRCYTTQTLVLAKPVAEGEHGQR